MITNGLHLEVLGYQTSVARSFLPDLVVRSFIPLPVTSDDGERSNRPVAMATGYLRKAKSGERETQVCRVLESSLFPPLYQ